MNLTGISETKRFGQNIYNIEGYSYTVLHAGRPVQGEGEAVKRNEGVGIVMDPRKSEA